MTGKKIVGLDVNGWRDHVARNWTMVPGGEERIGSIHIGGAGPLSSVVRIGSGSSEHWFGGFPADIAPHGLGGGWGMIGDESRRVFVRDLIEGRTGEEEHLAAAFTGLARERAQAVLAIEDSPETTEAMQERLLAGMAAARMRNPALVWRTVLSVLYAIENDLIREECTVGIVSHVSSGLSVQRLRVRRAGALGDVLAPERRNTASILGAALGLRELISEAQKQAVPKEETNARATQSVIAKTIGRLALGLPCQREIIRLQNGAWEEIALNNPTMLPLSSLREPAFLDGCDRIFFETIAEGDVRRQIEQLLSDCLDRTIETLPTDAVARGALVAAQRISTGDPVYFDFLPRISTIVAGRDEPRNYDLIDESETLEAGRIYRSPHPAKLAIPIGHDAITIYLRKDAEPLPRKATVALGTPLATETPVSVWVEQKPAAGRARIVVEAASLGRSFTVDWDKAEEDPRDWDEIIASFATPPPAVPDRLVLKCGMHPWHDSPRAPGMSCLLSDAEKKGAYDWEVLAEKAMARPFQEYCVSSDGELPEGVTAQSARQLDAAINAAVAATHARLNAGEAASQDNDALRFLTWQFRRCPSQVVEWLASCIENHAGTTGRHPFTWHPTNWVLIFQGAARIVQDPDVEQRLLRAVLRQPIETWNRRAESACVSLMLSRSKTAPELLSREDVELIARRAILEFNEEHGTQYTRFSYSPFLIGGLLRWRLKEPKALLIGYDPIARELDKVVEQARNDLNSRHTTDLGFNRRREKYIPILDGLLDYIRGKEGNPDLLFDIYNA